MALENLKTYPGPNLQYRRDHGGDWIGWWINFLENDTPQGQMVPFDKIRNILVESEEYGVLFAGGLEGHGGHRFAVDHILKYVRPILLLERNKYVEQKARGGPYLDLRARISMWVLYNPKVIVSVLPEMPDGADPSVNYKNLFDQTGADYCFASLSDPNFWEKVARGKSAFFTAIPNVNIQHTTYMVKRLGPDADFGKLLSTTDYVSKMLPSVSASDFDDMLQYLEPALNEI